MTSRNAVRRSVSAAELPAFTPVPRKSPRHDGWTPERQRAFIEALADTGCVSIACRMVNMSQPSFYQLRRQPGATSFRAAADAAQTLGLQCVKDEAFDRAMHGQLVPVFVAGKLMGFRRKKNDRLLKFILRNYGFGPGGTRTTVNYVSTRASAGAASAPRPLAGSGPLLGSSGGRTCGSDGLGRGSGGKAAAAAAEASTTTVRTMMTGGNGRDQRAADDAAANILNAFEGVPLDAEAQAEIYRTLEACAERRRALEADPENDPERFFIGERETNGYLGELESGVEDDWVEYRPEGEHLWENLGEGGQAAEIDRVLAEMEERKKLPAPDEPLDPSPLMGSPPASGTSGGRTSGSDGRERVASKDSPHLDPDDPRLDWRNWGDGGYAPPSEPTPSPQDPVPSPRKAYKKRTPKPPFIPPDEVRKADAVAEVKAERGELAAAEAERRERRKGGLSR